MMMQLVTGTFDLEGEAYTSYGICCGETVFRDVCLDRASMEAFVDLCNREGLDACQLPDAVMDFVEALGAGDPVGGTKEENGPAAWDDSGEQGTTVHGLSDGRQQAVSRLQDMMYAYLIERDAEKMLPFFTEDVQSIGSGIQEVAFGKSQLRQLVEEEIAQDPLPFALTFEKVVASPVEGRDLIVVYMEMQVQKELSAGFSIRVMMRQTAGLCEIGGDYYIRTVHVSVPAAQQEDNEYYPIQFGERSLHERRTKFDGNLLSLMSETMPGGAMGCFNEPGFPLYFVNDRLLKNLGHTYDSFVEATGGEIARCIYPGDSAKVEAAFRQTFRDSGVHTVVFRMLKRDGGFIWVYSKGRRSVTDDGREAIISVCLDITSKVEAENELAFIAQSKIGGLFKARMSEGFPVLYANEQYYQLHGYTKEELHEKFQDRVEALVYPDDIEEIIRKITRAIEEKQESLMLEYRIIRGDGKIAWLQASAGLTDTTEGTMLSGMVINIDERKHFEQQLLWSEKRFQIAIEQTRINVWEYDLPSRSILQTEKSRKTFGIGMVIPHVPESLIQNGCIHPDDAEKYADLYKKLHRGEKSACEVVRIRAMDGRYYWEKINYTNIFDENGLPVRAVAVSEDITAQREAEQRFFQEEDLREMLSADVLISAKINLA